MGISLALLAVLATTALVFALGWWRLGHLLYATPDPKTHQRALDVGHLLDAVKIGLAVVAGLGAAVGLTVSYRKQRGEEDKAFTDRYAAAAEQLGHDKAAVRLAGVYALGRLADDWEPHRQTCIDVLCAYLRMPYQPESAESGEREVRLTVIRLIRDHLRPTAPVSWSGHDLDFTGATFDGGDFSDAKFSGGQVSFNGATFSGRQVSFNGAEFRGGQVSFDRATFSGSWVTFDRATFSGGGWVTFDGAEFSGGWVTFDRAEFSGGWVTFDRATFGDGEVRFDWAKFSGDGVVSFDWAKFSGGWVTFDRATFGDGEVSFGGAEFSGGQVTFARAKFGDGQVTFARAKFGDGEVSFGGAEFSGGQVSFGQATFGGGVVDLSRPGLWSVPPQGLPAGAVGLRLPERPADRT